MATKRIPVPNFKPIKGVKIVTGRKGRPLTPSEKQAYWRLKHEEYETSVKIKNIL